MFQAMEGVIFDLKIPVWLASLVGLLPSNHPSNLSGVLVRSPHVQRLSFAAVLHNLPSYQPPTKTFHQFCLKYETLLC